VKDKILAAMRADSIPAAKDGLWYIMKQTYHKRAVGLQDGKPVDVPPGSYTFLIRWTTATLHTHGDTVMHDCPHELNSHLNFVLRAHGHVLVTGLGLGCVARGLLANPRVRFVTVIEMSKSVLRMVYPHMPTKRIQILRSDATRWVKQNRRKFDCAYHDLWSDPDAGDPKLQLMHSRMMSHLGMRAPVQGAWAHPRWSKRAWNERTPLTVF
jgi:hypothetical protein